MEQEDPFSILCKIDSGIFSNETGLEDENGNQGNLPMSSGFLFDMIW